jgi:hypothetical protein
MSMYVTYVCVFVHECDGEPRQVGDPGLERIVQICNWIVDPQNRLRVDCASRTQPSTIYFPSLGLFPAVDPLVSDCFLAFSAQAPESSKQRRPFHVFPSSSLSLPLPA